MTSWESLAAERTLRREAIKWLAGRPAGALVDAAANALAAGMDTPSLRLLAGATRGRGF